MQLLDIAVQFEKRVANPVLRLVAPHAPYFGVIHHKGRKSGKEYATPITLVARDEAFYINLGPRRDRDWLKNLAAADGGVVRHRGADYPVGPAEVRPSDQTPMPSAAKAFIRAGSYAAVLPKRR